ncbi:MAG: hypothetical protein P8M22_08185 [Phycisphaerales bacterium]|nr:hypothetical protein [Phycisphaerales bacterium]
MSFHETTPILRRVGLRTLLCLATASLPNMLMSTTHAGVQWAQWTDDSNFMYVLKQMPDFDQNRAQDDPDKVGFPSNGSNFCAPTACGNAMAYIANHGFTEIEPGQGLWGSQFKYNDSGMHILELADEMDTDPDSGTAPNDIDDPIRERLKEKFVVTDVHLSSTFTPNFETMTQVALDDQIVVPYYLFCNTNQNDDGFTTLSPFGGHMVTFTYAKADENERTIGVRDPGSGGTDLYSQSAFKTRMWSVSDFQILDGGELKKMSRIGGTGSSRWLWGWVAIQPKCAYSWQPYDNGFNYYRLGTIAGSQGASNIFQRLDDFEHIVDLLPDPDNHKAWLLAKQQNHYKLFPISNHDGSIDPSPIDNLVRPTAMAFDRHRNLHVLDEGNVNQYGGDDQEFIGAIPLPSPAPKMVVDDRSDSLVILLPQTGHLAYLPVDYSADLQTKRLPSNVSFSESMDMAINPVDGSVFLLDVEADRAWHVTEDRGELVAEALQLAGAEGATGIQVDDSGDLLVSAREAINAYQKVDRDWIVNPDNARHGNPCGPRFKINRSRSNWTDDMDRVPNIEETGEGAQDLLDCDADVNWDRSVDVEDLLVVLESWNNEGGSPGDITDNQRVDIEDVLIVVSNWGNCPD